MSIHITGQSFAYSIVSCHLLNLRSTLPTYSTISCLQVSLILGYTFRSTYVCSFL